MNKSVQANLAHPARAALRSGSPLGARVGEQASNWRWTAARWSGCCQVGTVEVMYGPLASPVQVGGMVQPAPAVARPSAETLAAPLPALGSPGQNPQRGGAEKKSGKSQEIGLTFFGFKVRYPLTTLAI